MIFYSNLFWCIIGTVGGGIISLIFYIVGQKRKRLNYNIKTFCLVSNKVDQIKGLEVKYNSKEIDNLYSSTITIKNTGNTVIEKQDVSPSCPLSISTDGMFLVNDFNDTGLYSSNKVNHSYVSYNFDATNNQFITIVFNFDYIGKKEEWTYTILHTGNVKFNGALKDGKITNITETEKRIERISLPFIEILFNKKF